MVLIRLVLGRSQMSKDTGRLTSFKRKELGASQVGTLVLGHGFVSPNEILQMAVDEHNGIPIEGLDNPKMEAGRELEDAIASMFSNEIARQGKKDHSLKLQKKATVVELANGKLGSSVDRVLSFAGSMLDITDSNGENVCLNAIDSKGLIAQYPVEIKNYSGLPTDPVSPHYEYQLQQQMYCGNHQGGFIVRLVRGWELQFFYYKANAEMQNEIVNAGTDFWNRFDGVLEGKDFWYDPVDTKEASKIYKGNKDKEVVNMDSETSLKPLIEKFVKARDEEKLAKIRKDEASLEIKMLMKEVELASHKGYVLRHTTSKRQKTKMIKIPDEFTETRVFTIKEMKEND